MTRPALVFSLAQGITILPSGTLADVVGNEVINLLGTLTLGFSVLGVGLSTSSIRLILFRVLQGVGAAMCFPSSVALLGNAFPRGRMRNIAFGCLGLGTPLGFAAGILLAGRLESVGVGWRAGFYSVTAVALVTFLLNLRLLAGRKKGSVIWHQL